MTLKSLFTAGLFVTGLLIAGDPAAAKSGILEPVFINGAVICPDGGSRAFAGGAPTELVMQMLCLTPADHAAQTQEQAWAAMDKARQEDWSRAAMSGQLGVWEGLKASWQLGSLDFLKGLAMAHPLWVLYFVMFLSIFFKPEKKR